jgi:serine/threonine protein kinase
MEARAKACHLAHPRRRVSEEREPKQRSAATSPLESVVDTPDTVASVTDPLVGKVLDGKYAVDGLIGVGGMGKVYKGRNLRTESPIAIKTLMPELVEDETLVKRFEVEAKSASNLRHPNTIRIYDFGREGNLLFMVMELLDGQSLERYLSREGVLSPRRVIHVMRQVCSSLTEAHGTGMVHRDLKPDNIFLNRVGGDQDFVKVLDFGVAKLKDKKFGSQTLTQAGMIFGTPRYMSPEQARAHELDARSDIYALGIIMFECLTGHAPFEAPDPISVLIKHVNEPPPAFRDVNPNIQFDDDLERLVLRCMAKDPKERPGSVQELNAVLEEIDLRLQRGATTDRPAVGAATRAMPEPKGPPSTGATHAPDTFDRLGVGRTGASSLGDKSIMLGAELHPHDRAKAPVVLIAGVAVALVSVAVGLFVFIGKSDPVAPKAAEAAGAAPAAPAAPAAAEAKPAGVEAAVAAAQAIVKLRLHESQQRARQSVVTIGLTAEGAAATARIEGSSEPAKLLPAQFSVGKPRPGGPADVTFIVEAPGEAAQTVKVSRQADASRMVSFKPSTARPSGTPASPGTARPSGTPASPGRTPQPGGAQTGGGSTSGGMDDPYK